MHYSIELIMDEKGTQLLAGTYDYQNRVLDACKEHAQLLNDNGYHNDSLLIRLHGVEKHPINVYAMDSNGQVEVLPKGEQWFPSDIDNAEYVGIVEFQSNDGEWHNFTVVNTGWHLVFGGTCNVGLLESGSFLIDQCFSLDENLDQLLSDLESYYNDGPGCQSDNFLVNACM